MRVKYVDSHCRQVSDSKLSAALESFIAVTYPFESKKYIIFTLRQSLTHFDLLGHDVGLKYVARCRYYRLYCRNHAVENTYQEKTQLS